MDLLYVGEHVKDGKKKRRSIEPKTRIKTNREKVWDPGTGGRRQGRTTAPRCVACTRTLVPLPQRAGLNPVPQCALGATVASWKGRAHTREARSACTRGRARWWVRPVRSCDLLPTSWAV